MNKEDFTLTLQHWDLEDMQPRLFLAVTRVPLLKAQVASKIAIIPKCYIISYIYKNLYIASLKLK